jgi:colanic acid/amylovoran biosynthesis glycosyltransferase
MTSTTRPKLAYLVSRFPTVTETFILREIIEVERQGLPISLYTLIRENPEVVHEDAKPWMNRLRTIHTLALSTLVANLLILFTRPLLYIGLLLLTVRDLWGCWNFLARDLFLFPKAVAFARIMQREGIEHLHAHWATHTAYVAFIVHRLNGISYSFTAHAHDIYVRKAMLCRKVHAARFVATISHFNVAELVTDCGEGVRDKIHVVRCGVPVERYTPHQANNSDPFTIVTVASLRDYKGHPEAIKACKLLKSRLPAFRWLVIGGGPDRLQLEQLIQEANVSDVFHLLGARPEHEVRRLMEEADLYVMTSIMLPDRRMDGIPVALMEGMAMAIPTVATRVSGIPELVEDGMTGRLVPERDENALVEAILDLHDHPERARALGQAGRQRVQEDFTVQGNAALLVSLFREALRESASRYRT